MKFTDLNINTVLLNALEDIGLTDATPIQEKAFPVIMSGKDVVGIAQTGTGKTFAYILPILRQLKYSEKKHPRVLVLVPTRELVEQVAGEFRKMTEYMSVRVGGVYGGTNINTQKELVYAGLDILVATPGRLIDLCLTGVLRLKTIQKLVIDEVDEMLNLGFRAQLEQIQELLPDKRQNLMFSATVTDDVETLINQWFYNPIRVEVAATGTPLEKIFQTGYIVPNFYTKRNLLVHLLGSDKTMEKVLVFVQNKSLADLLFDELNAEYPEQIGVIHSNKSQNFRFRMVEEFLEGKSRVLIATDLIARGMDISQVSHVVNYDLPETAESYIHRIGRTGRAESDGMSIAFVTENDEEIWASIQRLMKKEVVLHPMPVEVNESERLLESEKEILAGMKLVKTPKITVQKGAAFHEKKDKNNKTNQGGSYRRKLAAKYKKPKTRGQKRK
ncbi:DEAD/DEAH box helicase [Carboxylicivirga marina]|uniref:DEAD/DEAH box helicase n=1 Tax=Carboxylicivirga marina TaxID=2800988 RepID=A0ABS1HJF5_9BACT|nr:DEAD/DEAH box helicase [Carboxylicivirga marina]MBK3517818.1 DEAD/DEAH box helicase [Carboxylicivirga marina]